MTDIICFDLDGTLTDPKLGIFRCIRYALDKLDFNEPQTDDDLRSFIGPPLLHSFETLLNNKDEAKEALRLYRERFAATGLYENEIYEGIEAVLKGLNNKGKRLFVATSKPAIYAEKIVNYFALEQYFERVYGSELNGIRSDKTELLKWILTREALHPANTTMVGDRRHDIIGAHNNQMNSVGVLYGYGDRQELLEARAHAICERPADLIPTLT